MSVIFSAPDDGNMTKRKAHRLLVTEVNYQQTVIFSGGRHNLCTVPRAQCLNSFQAANKGMSMVSPTAVNAKMEKEEDRRFRYILKTTMETMRASGGGVAFWGGGGGRRWIKLNNNVWLSHVKSKLKLL